MRLSVAVAALVLLVCACGPIGSGGNAPNAASVAVQPGDVPSGMQKCDVSGDFNSYLEKTKAKDPTHYTQIKQEWDDAQKNGATAGQVAVYSDTAAHCAS